MADQGVRGSDRRGEQQAAHAGGVDGELQRERVRADQFGGARRVGLGEQPADGGPAEFGGDPVDGAQRLGERGVLASGEGPGGVAALPGQQVDGLNCHHASFMSVVRELVGGRVTR